MNQSTVEKTLAILDSTYPTILMHEIHGHDPFQLLIAVILSQRARDNVTVPLASKLFSVASTPQTFVDLPLNQLEEIIRPIGFYHAKSVAIKKLALIVVEQYGGKVPQTESELLGLPCVGRKTANIILTTFFDTPQIAVDIHVHRITNRLGWVKTTKPEETEVELTKIIPKRLHSIVNRVFVAHGQNTCLPRHPKCELCPIEKYCLRVNV